MQKEFLELHQKAINIAQSFHKAESDLIDILQKIDQQKIFLKLGFASLFDYALKALKLSEANSSNFITVARKSKIVPELKEAIKEGRLSVSKARKITPVLTPENKDIWLNMAEVLPKAKLEKEIAKALPEKAVQERASYVSPERVKLTVGLSERAHELLKRVQDLECQKRRAAINFEQTIEAALELYIKKLDPVERAKARLETEVNKQAEMKTKVNEGEKFARELKNEVDAAASVPGHMKITQKRSKENQLTLQGLNQKAFQAATPNINQTLFKRARISQSLKHQIFLRDKGKCQHKDQSGNKCHNSRWIQVHHKTPVTHGGQNELNSLITLCSGHHKLLHL